VTGRAGIYARQFPLKLKRPPYKLALSAVASNPFLTTVKPFYGMILRKFLG
jgi:hypothetical protein